MAKVKIINKDLNQNLNGTYFNNVTSNTIFSLGGFSLTSNFDGKETIDYSSELSTFVRPVTLETLNLTETQSSILEVKANSVVLNLDKSDLKTFVRFGSAYEFLRVSIQNIILNYPGSLYFNSNKSVTNITGYDFYYNSVKNESEFKIPINTIENKFNLIYKHNNFIEPDNIKLKNLNLSFDKYTIWSTSYPKNKTHNIIGFTGNTNSNNYLNVKVNGNPFPFLAGTGQTIFINFHIKPSTYVFEEIRETLNDYEKFLMSERDGVDGFKIILKEPILLDNGEIRYNDKTMLWQTVDGYNIEYDTSTYSRFLESLLIIGAKYDAIKTDLIARFLSPQSIKVYDQTNDKKITKLLRLYGREFDQIREFIDSLVHINKVTYDKRENIPDILIKNLANTFGWDYFSLLNENELVESFLTIDENERNLKTDLMPAEIDIELWRRILINTNYFWKTKGTRHAIKSMFLLIGIPEQFINITEYVYTVDGKIDPRDVTLDKIDFPTNAYPFYDDGYPKAPPENNDFYFQIAGNSDGGEEYMNVFRSAGFTLIPNVDNKKSWVGDGNVIRKHPTTPQYFQQDSKLVLNTKAVDVALDAAQGIEWDVYDYIKEDYIHNSSGYTMPFSYVNVSLNYNGTGTTFQLPSQYDKAEGDLEVRFNGILLNAPKEYDGVSVYDETTEADYIVTGNTFTLTNNNYALNQGNRRDVIQATYIYSGDTYPISGITVEYVVTRVKSSILGTEIDLPSNPNGDIQLTINGIALTKGTDTFSGDYIVDVVNNKIIIQNQEVIGYLTINPYVQIAYINVIGTDLIEVKNEVYKIHSFNTGKLYYNVVANKYVYKLNFKASKTEDIKVLVNGIMLEPITDYTINNDNQYEIFLPKSLRYGYVISVYYLVGGNEIYYPVVEDSFGLGDISELSFLEFINMASLKLKNARTRKIVTDFKGGWYPTLLHIYQKYIDRSKISGSLKSNGYTFEMLYPFLSKYNSFFQRFVDQLLPATIILKKNGLLVRNSIFTQQKFTYKRGVTLIKEIGQEEILNIQYLGDDGSMFKTIQSEVPAPIELSVQTKSGVFTTNSINNTGGLNVFGYDELTNYGVEYRVVSNLNPLTYDSWIEYPSPLYVGSLTENNYTLSITGLNEGTIYQYRAVIKLDELEAKGSIFSGITDVTPPPPTPSVDTFQATDVDDSSFITGGRNIVRYQDVTRYGILYRKIGDNITTPSVNTGNATNVGENSFDIINNIITDKGGTSIDEYGILYKLYSPNDLLYENIGSGVFVKSISADTSTQTPFTQTIDGLLPNNSRFFRAFAKNSAGVGYGTVKQQTTLIATTARFSSVDVNNNVLTTITNDASGKVYKIVYEWYISSYAEILYGGGGTVYSSTEIRISKNNYSPSDFVDGVYLDTDGDYEQDNKTGTYTLSNITDLSKLKATIIIDYYQEDFEIGGDGWIEIKNVYETSTGTDIPIDIICNNKVTYYNDNNGTLNCTI